MISIELSTMTPLKDLFLFLIMCMCVCVWVKVSEEAGEG